MYTKLILNGNSVVGIMAQTSAVSDFDTGGTIVVFPFQQGDTKWDFLWKISDPVVPPFLFLIR